MKARYSLLLASLVIYIILAPQLAQWELLQYIGNVLLASMLLVAMYTMRREPGEVIVGTAFALPGLVGIFFDEYPYIFLGSLILIWIFFTYTSLQIGRFLFHTKKVGFNLLAAALSNYLLIGLGFSILFLIIELFHPGHFTGAIVHVSGGRELYSYLYYSFVTLTSLGYGDITPATNLGRSLAVLEAVIGQFYLAVVIARLIGLHLRGQI